MYYVNVWFFHSGGIRQINLCSEAFEQILEAKGDFNELTIEMAYGQVYVLRGITNVLGVYHLAQHSFSAN